MKVSCTVLNERKKWESAFRPSNYFKNSSFSFKHNFFFCILSARESSVDSKQSQFYLHLQRDSPFAIRHARKANSSIATWYIGTCKWNPSHSLFIVYKLILSSQMIQGWFSYEKSVNVDQVWTSSYNLGTDNASGAYRTNFLLNSNREDAEYELFCTNFIYNCTIMDPGHADSRFHQLYEFKRLSPLSSIIQLWQKNQNTEPRDAFLRWMEKI